MPDELRAQFPVAKELLASLGYHILELEGYEADDILGTLAEQSKKDGARAYLLTGDRDALQLIDEDVHVLLATNFETIDMDKAAFFAKYGVPSDHFVDVKALMGDSSDNIPGVPGVGEKTALKLIADFGTLDGVYERIDEAGSTPSLRKKLEEGKESAYLSKTLATICRTVPLGIALDDLADRGIDRKAAKALFLRLEFSGFLKRFALDAPMKTDAPELAAKACTLAELEQSLADCKLLSLDFFGEDKRIFDGKTLYTVASTTREVLEKLSGKRVVLYDAKSLYKEIGDCPCGAELFDLQLAAYLVNPSKNNYEFSSLVADYLGEVIGDGEPAWYAFRLYPEILAKLEESGQTSLLFEIEQPLSRVLASMETYGFFIDRSGIASRSISMREESSTSTLRSNSATCSLKRLLCRTAKRQNLAIRPTQKSWRSSVPITRLWKKCLTTVSLPNSKAPTWKDCSKSPTTQGACTPISSRQGQPQAGFLPAIRTCKTFRYAPSSDANCGVIFCRRTQATFWSTPTIRRSSFGFWRTFRAMNT